MYLSFHLIVLRRSWKTREAPNNISTREKANTWTNSHLSSSKSCSTTNSSTGLLAVHAVLMRGSAAWKNGLLSIPQNEMARKLKKSDIVFIEDECRKCGEPATKLFHPAPPRVGNVNQKLPVPMCATCNPQGAPKKSKKGHKK